MNLSFSLVLLVSPSGYFPDIQDKGNLAGNLI
jgi:hypothetical protein